MPETRDERHDANWARVPDDLKKRIVDHLRSSISPEVMDQFKTMFEQEPDWLVREHFGVGMSIRNLLRNEVKDEELPPVDYGDAQGYRNWDDYYVKALREASGGDPT